MDYLTEENGSCVHYFFRAGEGICMQRARAQSWQPRECILRGGRDGFGLYPDNERIHIVTTNDYDELVYLVGTSADRRRFLLKKLSGDAKIRQIRLYSVRGRLNMLYSVSLNDEILLMHCILGNNARPHTVAKLAYEDFFIHGMNVYFTAADKSAGYAGLADEKPDLCIRLIENCSVPYLYGGHIAYIANGKVYFDKREVCADPDASGVIITESDARLYVAWKSGDYVRYLPADGSSKPYCIINPSREAKLYAVVRSDSCEYLYGSNSESELVTYINPRPFGPRTQGAADLLRRRLEDMKTEITDLKSRLAAEED